jgi:hypothetical protein
MGGDKEKNKNLSFTLLILITIFLPLVSGLAFTPNSEADIKQTIRVEGGLPSSSVSCNISVQSPNNTILVDYKEMTRSPSGQYYNYTLTQTQTQTIGVYSYDITCLSATANKTDSFQFYVNPGAVVPSETKTNTITRTIYFMAAIGLIFFISFMFSREGNPTYKYTYLIISFIFFLISTNMIFIGLQDDVVNTSIQNFFSTFTAISFYILWFLGFILASLWIIAVINTIIYKNNEKKMRRLGDFGDYYG